MHTGIAVEGDLGTPCTRLLENDFGPTNVDTSMRMLVECRISRCIIMVPGTQPHFLQRLHEVGASGGERHVCCQQESGGA